MKYLLLGLGVGNRSIKKYFEKHGIEYYIYDDFIAEYQAIPKKFDVIVKSSGVRNDHFLIKDFPYLLIVTDLELFYQFSKSRKCIVVTGTNGKTTTVSLIKKIIGDKVCLAGNIGKPLFDYIETSKDLVIEASSFMLEYVHTFNAKINVILNINHHHLDHHHTFEKYVESKQNLIKNCKNNDYIIYNCDDEKVSDLVQKSKGIMIPISLSEQPKGCYLKNDFLFYEEKAIIGLNEILLQGQHNLYNIMASIVVSLLYGINIYQIREAIKNFRTLEHRIEYVDTINDVEVYNDSKSTNFQSLRSSLLTFQEKKVLLICGGMIERGTEFKDNFNTNLQILDNCLENVNEIRAFGENRYLFSKYFAGRFKKVIIYNDFNDIFSNIDFKRFDIILFSPGSVSYDMFKNYEERGTIFKKLYYNYFGLIKY